MQNFLRKITVFCRFAAGSQTCQRDILSKVPVWNVKKNCLGFYFNPNHCYSIHFDVAQLFLKMCVQRQYIISIKCQNIHCTHTQCTVVSCWPSAFVLGHLSFYSVFSQLARYGDQVTLRHCVSQSVEHFIVRDSDSVM